jgi:uncharacterized surface anchored protein
VSANDDILVGAHFDLYEKTAAGYDKVKEDITTTADNTTVTLTGAYLKVGTTYRLVETEAPVGYQLLDDPVEFNIDSKGQVYISGEAVPANTIKVLDDEIGILIGKTDFQGNYVAGATLTITSE